MKKVVLVVPVYNEESLLEDSIVQLYEFFKKNVKYDWKIVIADNASIDKTREISERLSKKFKRVELVYVDKKGRGIALRTAWQNYSADAYGYCDADLATDLSFISDLFKEIIEEKNNLTIGNRYLKSSNAERNPDRLFYSKIFNLIVRLLFKSKITDFQCGFKAIDRKTLEKVVPLIEDDHWFFDSELLILAERENYSIKQIPITWKEMRKKHSRVKVIKDSVYFLSKIILLRYKLWKRS